jgi:hypothetical protein
LILLFGLSGFSLHRRSVPTTPLRGHGKGAKTLGALIAAVGGVLVAFPIEGRFGPVAGTTLIAVGLLVLAGSLIRSTRS